MTEPMQGHMTPEEFRRCGYAAVDWIARYMQELESYPVLSQVQPGEIRDKLPPLPPERGEAFETLLRDLDDIILPGITHWQSPNFFAYFPANASGPAILGDLLSSGLGVQGMLWSTSPACTELETHVLDWLVEMLALPQRFKSTHRGGGVIQDSASSASLCALLAARERATDLQSNVHGIDRTLIAYTSTQAHSSIEKAVKIAGVGRDHLRMLPVDESYTMQPQALEQAISKDRACGYVPFFVSATMGTTSSTAVDPIARIADICQRQHLWLHVDAAHAGSAALCPEFRWLQEGLELADSYCFNPHKWMLTNFDCDCFYVADRTALINALSILPEYLKNQATASGAVFDYRDWQIPLGRRFRALKLWFVIRYYGIEGLRRHIRESVRLAQEFAHWVATDSQFVLAAPAFLNLVCFRHVDGDEMNQRLMDRLNTSGKIFLTHTRLENNLVLRMAIGGVHTQARHVKGAWDLIRETAAAMRACAP